MIQFDDSDLLILDKRSADRKRSQHALDYETQLSQNHLNNTRDMLGPTSQQMANNYTVGAANGMADYGDIMGKYRELYDSAISPSNATAQMVNYSRTPELSKAMGGYSEFADTGGYSDANIRDLRARGVSPIRAAYGNALNEMERRINVQGGYSPNANILRAKMARESGQMMADAVQNVNAGLADRINQGRQFGISGLGNLSVQDIGFNQQAQLANQAAALDAARINSSPYSAANQKLMALQGMAGMYSATPGQASTYGNQLLDSQRNLLGLQGLQNDIGNWKTSGQLGVANLRTGTQAGLENTQKGVNILTSLYGMGMGGKK